MDCLTEDAMTAGMFVETGLFPSLDVAQTFLRKGRKKKRWRANGTTFLRGKGHPEFLWTKGWIVRNGQQDHDVMVTYMRWAINATESWRHNLDKKIRPDLKIRMRNERHEDLTAFLEMDMGETSYDRIVEERYDTYVEQECKEPVLWVVHKETPKGSLSRMEGLRARAERIKGIAFFTTSYQLLENPSGDVFIDFEGKPWGLGNGNGPLVGWTIGNLIVKGIGKPW